MTAKRIEFAIVQDGDDHWVTIAAEGHAPIRLDSAPFANEAEALMIIARQLGRLLDGQMTVTDRWEEYQKRLAAEGRLEVRPPTGFTHLEVRNSSDAPSFVEVAGHRTELGPQSTAIVRVALDEGRAVRVEKGPGVQVTVHG